MSFGPAVEAWRDLVTELAGEVPVEFVLAWMAPESAGNICARGAYSGSHVKEAGLAQTYFETASTRVHGVTSGELRAMCAGISQQLARPPTDDERRMHAQLAVDTIADHRAIADDRLAAAGVSWGEVDCWRLTKLAFALPCIPKYLPHLAQQGEDVGSWEAFRAVVTTQTLDGARALDAATACSGANYYTHWNHYFDVSEACAAGIALDGVATGTVLDDVLETIADTVQGLVGPEVGELVLLLLVPGAALVYGLLARGLRMPV